MSNKHWCQNNEQHLNIDDNLDHQMSLSKSKCWYSNNYLQFSKRAVPVQYLCSAKILLINETQNGTKLGPMHGKTYANRTKPGPSFQI